ncbi:MAG: hypothetical protein ACOC2W_01325 [bacterium]
MTEISTNVVSHQTKLVSTIKDGTWFEGTIEDGKGRSYHGIFLKVDEQLISIDLNDIFHEEDLLVYNYKPFSFVEVNGYY